MFGTYTVCLCVSVCVSVCVCVCLCVFLSSLCLSMSLFFLSILPSNTSIYPLFNPYVCLSPLSLHVPVYPFFPSMCLSIPFFHPCICLSLCVIQTCYQNGYKGWPSLRRHNKIFYIVLSLFHLTHCLKPLHHRPIAYDQSNDTSSQWLC